MMSGQIATDRSEYTSESLLLLLACPVGMRTSSSHGPGHNTNTHLKGMEVDRIAT
jgi:hypothetical protein